LELVGNIAQGILITIPVAIVGINKGSGRLSAKHVFLDQFFHNPPVFSGQRFIIQFPKKNIFLLSVMRPISIHPYKINRDINEYGIYLVFRFDFGQDTFDNQEHPFDQTMLYHERTACLHGWLLPSSTYE
jgi:hypothetical protein